MELDREKYLKEGRYYKAVKREFAIKRMNGEEIPDWMVKFLLDPIKGNLSLAISRLEALERIGLSSAHDVRMKVYRDLSKLGIKERSLEKLRGLLNRLSFISLGKI